MPYSERHRKSVLIAFGLALAPSVANATPDLDLFALYFWIIPINAVGLVVGLLSSWIARIPVIRLLVIAACAISFFPGLLFVGSHFVFAFDDPSFEDALVLLNSTAYLILLPLAMYFLGRAISIKVRKLCASQGLPDGETK